MAQLDSSIDLKTLPDDVQKAYQDEETAAKKMRKARDKYRVAREKLAPTLQAFEFAKGKFAEAQTARQNLQAAHLEDDE